MSGKAAFQPLCIYRGKVIAETIPKSLLELRRESAKCLQLDSICQELWKSKEERVVKKFSLPLLWFRNSSVKIGISKTDRSFVSASFYKRKSNNIAKQFVCRNSFNCFDHENKRPRRPKPEAAKKLYRSKTLPAPTKKGQRMCLSFSRYRFNKTSSLRNNI